MHLTRVEAVKRGEAVVVDDYPSSDSFDLDDAGSELFIGGGKTTISLNDMDYLTWQRYLDADLENAQSAHLNAEGHHTRTRR